MKEEWTNIKGYEGKYIISNTGKVMSLNYNNTGKPKELKLKINRCGYKEVKLSKNNKTKDFMVAHLVAEHFISNPKKCTLVTHIDNNKLNDCYTNLKWVYLSETRFLAYKNGNRKGNPSENIISYKGKRYKSYSALAKDNNVKEPKQLFKRLYRGWDLETALEVSVNIEHKGSKPYYYDYYGKLLTVYQIAEKNNVSAKLINKRLGRGWNIYEAAEIPSWKKKEVKDE